MNKQDQEMVGRVIGQMLKEERAKTAEALAEVSEHVMLRGLLAHMLHSNLRAIKTLAEDVTLKRSRVLVEGNGGPSRAVRHVSSFSEDG